MHNLWTIPMIRVYCSLLNNKNTPSVPNNAYFS
jgi:hypothetical protein